MYGICERTGRNITYDESIFSLSSSFKVTSVLNVFRAENRIYFAEKEKKGDRKKESLDISWTILANLAQRDKIHFKN